MSFLFAQTSENLFTSSGSATSIPGLSLTLPEGSGVMALAVLNVPNPYAEGDNFPGGVFSIAVNGATSPVFASFTYNEQQPASTGRIPTTLVVGIPLAETEQTVEAQWAGVRGSTVILDSPATLSVIITD